MFGSPQMAFNTLIILPLAAFGVYLFLLRSILRERHPLPLPILLALMIGLKIAIDVSVTMINGYFLPPGLMEYLADVPKFESLGDILSNYVKRAKMLTTHSGTHPPGPVLVLWLATRLFGYHGMVKAVLIVITAPLSLIFICFLAKQFYNDDRVAIYTLALYLMTPSIILLTAVCMDAFFAVFLILSIYLFFHSLKKGSIMFAVLTGISFGVSMLLTFSTTFLGVYFIILTVLTYFTNRKEFLKHLSVLLISGAVFCVFYLLLYFLTGYNFLACLRGAILIDEKGSLHHSGCGTGYEDLSRYLFISWTNLFAFFSGIGLPTATLWFREVGSTIRNAFRGQEFPGFLLAYVIALILITFSTLYTTETERIWMFMAPFILIPAAANLRKQTSKKQNERMLYVVIVMLFLQTLAFEIFLDTLW